MGGFTPLPNFDSSDTGFQTSQARRRGLYPSLLDVDSTSSANGAPTSSGNRLVDRISDDPQSRHAAIDDATNDLESRVASGPQYRPVAPDEHMQDLQGRYQKEADWQPKKPGLLGKIGLFALSPFGSLTSYENSLARQRQQHQGNANSLLSQIEAERRMQEQEDIEGQRFNLQQRMQSERERAAQQSQERLFGQQQQIENQRETLRQQMAADAQRQQEAHQDAQFQHADESQQRMFAQQQALERQREEHADNKPTADETRRADLAENMTENLTQLEDIVRRRPDLFGPMAGRLTGWRQKLGTSDPDVAKLHAIKEYLGMASVGAHAMRNAQHVGAAADAVMAGFVNSPAATLAAIQSARDSVDTFKRDITMPLKERVQNIGNPRSGGGGGRDFGPAPQGKAEGSTGKLADGTRVVVRGGRIIAQ